MFKKLPAFLLLVCSTSFLLNAFANDAPPADPYQTYNRHAFAMNQTLDKVVFIPAATIYKTALPNYAQRRVNNFFGNINTVPVIANDILQLKVYQGTQDIWRLFFNTTFGLLGLYDVASKIGLPKHENDFGMTLANWGYENTNYFLIPFLGPSTVRDTIGLIPDYEVFSVYPYLQNVALRNSLQGLYFIQQRAQLLQLQDVMEQAAVDPYVFQRNAYLQRREYLIEKNLGEPHGYAQNTDPYVDE